MVKIHKKFMTDNMGYKWNVRNKINQKPNKIIIHSTATQGIMAADWFRRWNKDLNKSVHYFVDDKEAWYYLPENFRGWHVGGAWNTNSIGIEACEDKGLTKAYFNKLIVNYVDLVVDIMKRHPQIKVNNIWSHTEAGNRGVGTRSSDPVNHWWYKFGYTMDNFRDDVSKALKDDTYKPKPKPNPTKPKPEVDKPVTRLVVDGHWGNLTTRELQKALKTPIDGIITGQYPNAVTNAIPSVTTNNRAGSLMIRSLQRLIGAKVDGWIGTETVRRLQSYLGTPIDGIISRPSTMVKEMQRRLNLGTFLQDTKTHVGTIKPRQGANVRVGAGTGFRKAMNALRYGTRVNVLKEVNGWYEIEYQGKKGYVRKDLIQ